MKAWNHEYLLEKNSLEIVFDYGSKLRNSKNNDDAKEIFELLIEIINFKNTQTENTFYGATTPNIVQKKKSCYHTQLNMS